ncbi:MAG: hypothetical protein K5663_10260 [Clostridiales bacterium]|nr:hypothetical protein [Clostridiales bacterium]
MKRAQELLNGEGQNYILPFLWMKGEDTDTIRREIGKVAECGIREICLESRPHPDFAGPLWWESLDAVIDEARKRSMRIWILDDRKFPTGYANGGFAKRPELAKTYLAERHMDMIGPQEQAAVLISPFLGKDGELIGVFALRRKDGDSTDLILEMLIDLTDRVSDGFVYLDIPEGRYRLVVVYTTQNGGGRPQYMNLLDKDSVRVLIDEVYETHYAHYAEEFGRTIAGFFSDEPELGNSSGYDFHDLPGKVGGMLPWSKALREQMVRVWGAGFARSLPALWFECGSDTPRIRAQYMDMVTHLVQECFSSQIGKWCADHLVEYIGHIIEDDNAHGRLGCSIGHYFREMRGQDMAGVDVVHFQIVPGFEDKVHQWLAWDTDGAFFHYGLAKLAASQAHIDPKMKGRSLCEIFGNYGWACGIGMMKWLTNHMLVRGINHFTPHAFSMKYPDPDCPPHFYALGNNPQFPYFADLMRYMNRICHLFSGGIHCADAAVLYHAEAEWSGDPVMTFDKPGRALMENQLDYDVVPEDIFEQEQTVLKRVCEDRCLLEINREIYPCVVQPYFKLIPDELASQLEKAVNAGLPLFVVDALPESTVSGAPIPDGYRELAKVVPLDRLAESVASVCGHRFEFLASDRDTRKAYTHLRSMMYRHEDGCAVMFFNESVNEKYDARVRFRQTHGGIREYDAFSNCFEETYSKDGILELSLFPGQARVFILDDGKAEDCEVAKPYSEVSQQPLSVEWSLSVRDVNSSSFTQTAVRLSGKKLPSMNSPAYFRDFVGTYLYEGELDMPDISPECRYYLRFDSIGDCGTVRINGVQAGKLYGDHCSVEITDLLCRGANKVTVEVTNTPVWRVKDPVSTQIQLHPTGLTAQPVLVTAKKQ